MPLKRLFLIGIFLVFALSAVFSTLFSCTEFYRNKSHPEITNQSIRRGKALSSKYCGTCHLEPDPSLLDSKTWENGVLPQMGPRLGIFEHWFKEYPSERHNRNLDRSYYPSKPLLSFDDWQHIINYYIATSPDSLSINYARKTLKTTHLFKVEIPSIDYQMPATGLVKFARLSQTPELIISDVLRNRLYRFGSELQCFDSIKTSGPIVDLDIENGALYGCNIGQLNPHIGKLGSTESFVINAAGKLGTGSGSNLKGLERPVQLIREDFNLDGKPDFLVCEFGYLTGALSLMIAKSDVEYDRHIISTMPGAIKAYTGGYNNDKLPDIWVLFAQGDEGIYLFKNLGNGKFDEQRILRFPPSYGSSFFELVDFNKDGYSDIVYTAGDNADFSPILKPYHGVYIFQNDGKNNFKQEFFYPINGCYKALARDFDKDGDLDIATISFFADYKNNPQESFVYLENQGELEFTPYSIPQASDGRRLTMDAGDIDKDGRIDLVLGNFSVAPAINKMEEKWQKGPAFIVLKNISK